MISTELVGEKGCFLAPPSLLYSLPWLPRVYAVIFAFAAKKNCIFKRITSHCIELFFCATTGNRKGPLTSNMTPSL